MMNFSVDLYLQELKKDRLGKLLNLTYRSAVIQTKSI